MITLTGIFYSSKNHGRIIRVKGRPRFIKNANAEREFDELRWQLKQPHIKKGWQMMLRFVRQGLREGKEYPLRLHIKFYRRNHQRFDYANICQGLLDALVKEKYIPDDDAVHLIPVFEPFEVDPSNPRAELWLE